jgi:LmbE family N-acetylglucosaminyl deacetylase
MNFVVDATHLGTPESVWRRSGHLDALPALEVGRPRKVIVVAPHPDDEILGVGGLLLSLVEDRIPVEILAVTDGEGSHPRGTAARVRNLRQIRTGESLVALGRLGLRAPSITRLGLPDGRVADYGDRVREALEDRGNEDDLWLAPWWLDGHPDHDACGRAASAIAGQLGARSLHYLIWAWHWADPSGEDLPWDRCRRLDFDRSSANRKRWSIEAFDSQIRPLSPGAGDEPVLPSAVLTRFQRSFEVFIEGGVRS